MMAAEGGALQQAKLVLLGDMGAGKSSVVLRFVKGQFFDYQVSIHRSKGHIYCVLERTLHRFQTLSAHPLR